MKTRDELAAEYARIFKVFSDQDVAYGAFRAGHASRDAECAELREKCELLTRQRDNVSARESHVLKLASEAEKERDSARAQLEAMRGVVEAARQIIRYENYQEDSMDTIALDNALRAYDAAKGASK